MTDIEIIQLTQAPDRDKMNALLLGYYTGLNAAMASVGGPIFPLGAAIDDFWDHLDDYLPPNGCLLVAQRGDLWLGTGALRTLPSGAGELKRLFVLPETRGTGLGRKLVTKRIEIARQMGLKALFVDTVTPTTAMQSLYASLGFIEIGPYPESASHASFPEIRDFLLFFRKDIS